jgi:antitoxin VapB
MPLTRLFRSGNSQAVRIPAEIAYDDTAAPLQISRVGDVITIFPVGGSLGDAIAALRLLPKPPVELREPIELPMRAIDGRD